MEHGQKYYDNRRKEIKMWKRELKGANFDTARARKKQIEAIKQEYRANKRAEKHELKKRIDNDLLDK